MPTLFSITDKFKDRPEKNKEFLNTIKYLKKKFSKVKDDSYTKRAVQQLYGLLLASKEEDSRTIRKRIDVLLEDKEFKSGASVIEFSRDADFTMKLGVKNKKLLNFFEEQEPDLKKLRRYTIDSIKEVPTGYDSSNRTTERKEIIRIIEAVVNIEDFEMETDRVTINDLLKSRNWVEEDREGEDVEFHMTKEELRNLFPTKGLQIHEGRVFLVFETNVFDISELVRQKVKESYKKLLKFEGKKPQGRREKK